MLTITPESVDFGIAGPGDQARRTITVRNPGRQDLAARVRSAPPWVRSNIRESSSDRLVIELELEPRGLVANGRQTASLELDVGGKITQIRLAVTAAGRKSSARSGARSGRRPSTSRPRSSMSAAPFVTVGVVGLAFWQAYHMTAIALATVPNGHLIAVAVVGSILLIYVTVACSRAMPPRRLVLNARTADSEHRRLLATAEKVWARASLPAPKVVVNAKPVPTMCVHGLLPKMSCLYVNQGLLTALQEDVELEAVLSHEVAHQNRWDTVYMAFLNPILWVTARALGAVLGTLHAFSRVGRGGPSPFTRMFLMFGLMRAGWMGLLVLLMIAWVLAFFAMYAAIAAAVGIAVVLFVLICLLKYSQYIEKEADLAAAKMVGDSDWLLAALARCVDHFPIEMQIMQEFAGKHLKDPENYALADIVAAIKNGARVQYCGSWRERHLRTHPPVLGRIANIVKAHGSRIT